MIVRINAIQADAAMGPELERRFAERAGEVEKIKIQMEAALSKLDDLFRCLQYLAFRTEH